MHTSLSHSHISFPWAFDNKFRCIYLCATGCNISKRLEKESKNYFEFEPKRYFHQPYFYQLTVIDGNIDLHTGLNADTRDLLYNVTGSVQINQPFVNAHLEAIPSVGTLSTGSLTGGNAQFLCGKTHGSFDAEFLVQGTLFQVRADLFEVLDVAGREGDADTVHLGAGILEASLFLSRGNVGGHSFELCYTRCSLPTGEM